MPSQNPVNMTILANDLPVMTVILTIVFLKYERSHRPNRLVNGSA